jgi:hypothetical protein
LLDVPEHVKLHGLSRRRFRDYLPLIFQRESSC